MDENKLKNTRRVLLITSIVLLLVGIALIVWPEGSLAVFATAAGILLILAAVINGILFFRSEKMPFDIIGFIFSLAILALGIYIVADPAWLVALFGTIFGIVVILWSVVIFANAVGYLRRLDERWWILLLLSLAGMVLGVLVLLKPLGIATVLTIFTGAVLVYTALIGAVSAFRLREKKEKKEE